MILKLLATAGLTASLSLGAFAARPPFGPGDDGHKPPATTEPAKPHDDKATKTKAKSKEAKEAKESRHSASLRVGEKGRFRAGKAGEATVVRTRAGLKLRSVDAVHGWVSHVERPSGSSVEVTFRATGSLIRLLVELDGASVEVRVITHAPAPSHNGATGDTPASGDDASGEESPDAEDAEETTTEASAPETTVHEVRDAGTVELRRHGRHVVIADVKLKAGWTVDVKRRAGSGVEATFHKAKIRLHFKAVIVGARIDTRIVTGEQPTEKNKPASPAPEPDNQGHATEPDESDEYGPDAGSGDGDGSATDDRDDDDNGGNEGAGSEDDSSDEY